MTPTGRACCRLVPLPTRRDTAASAGPTAAAPIAAGSTAPGARSATGPRNLFIVLVLAGVLLPSPAGPVALLGAVVVSIRSKMRPWIPAVLLAGAIALTSYTIITASHAAG